MDDRIIFTRWPGKRAKEMKSENRDINLRGAILKKTPFPRGAAEALLSRDKSPHWANMTKLKLSSEEFLFHAGFIADLAEVEIKQREVWKF